jgi:hypothetical protein
MTSSSDFEHFAANLLALELNETRRAIACLWFADSGKALAEMTAREIANLLLSTGLAGNINVSRLALRLKKSTDTVKGVAKGAFRIAPARKASLTAEFGPLLKRRKVVVSDDLLPDEMVKGTRPFLEKLAHQINGCYDASFYDGCAVLCRRMVECLLIEVFDKAGQLAAIKNADGSLMMFDGILGRAKSGQHIRLPRGAAGVLDKIKEIGDAAAHDRYHITSEQDIGEFRSAFR